VLHDSERRERSTSWTWKRACECHKSVAAPSGTETHTDTIERQSGLSERGRKRWRPREVSLSGHPVLRQDGGTWQRPKVYCAAAHFLRKVLRSKLEPYRQRNARSRAQACASRAQSLRAATCLPLPAGGWKALHPAGGSASPCGEECLLMCIAGRYRRVFNCHTPALMPRTL
jgi:hypothetical protein